MELQGSEPRPEAQTEAEAEPAVADPSLALIEPGTASIEAGAFKGRRSIKVDALYERCSRQVAL